MDRRQAALRVSLGASVLALGAGAGLLLAWDSLSSSQNDAWYGAYWVLVVIGATLAFAAPPGKLRWAALALAALGPFLQLLGVVYVLFFTSGPPT